MVTQIFFWSAIKPLPKLGLCLAVWDVQVLSHIPNVRPLLQYPPIVFLVNLILSLTCMQYLQLNRYRDIFRIFQVLKINRTFWHRLCIVIMVMVQTYGSTPDLELLSSLGVDRSSPVVDNLYKNFSSETTGPTLTPWPRSLYGYVGKKMSSTTPLGHHD